MGGIAGGSLGVPSRVEHFEHVGLQVAMLYCLASIDPLLASVEAVWAPLLAQQGGSRTYGVSWAIVLLCVALGLIVTLKSSRRTSEVKKAREY